MAKIDFNEIQRIEKLMAEMRIEGVDEGAEAPKPGDKMPDGTSYAGISPDTGTIMFLLPLDNQLATKWRGAQKLNKQFAYGHDDWRRPSESEASLLEFRRGVFQGDIANAIVRTPSNPIARFNFQTGKPEWVDTTGVAHAL